MRVAVCEQTQSFLRFFFPNLPPQVRKAKSRVSAINLELSDEGIDLEEIEREILVQALERHDWNQTRAAKYLKHPPEDSHSPNGEFGLGEMQGAPSTISPQA